MSMTAIEGEVKAYLSALRAHLKDLPEHERDDLLEDLEQHLTEVRAEGEGSLIERLGPPDVYAAELRASVGIAPVSGSALTRLLERVTSAPAVSGFRTFLPELRPGWWVLRGLIAAAAPVVIFANREVQNYLTPPAELTVVGLIAVGVGAWLSVKLGRRSTTSAGVRMLARAANVVVIAVALIAWIDLSQTRADFDRYIEDLSNRSTGYLQHEDGEAIANICPYDKKGKPLKGVLIFDGHGRPITNLAPLYEQDPPKTATPPNAFPRKLRDFDPNTGNPATLRCPKVIVTPLPVEVDTSADAGATPEIIGDD